MLNTSKRKQKKRQKRNKEQSNKQKTVKDVIDTDPTISIITLKVNGLNKGKTITFIANNKT